MVSAWRNFKNIFSRQLFTFRPEMPIFHFDQGHNGRICHILCVNLSHQLSVPDKTMTENVTCQNHNDCDFFDCKGQCDLITNKCTKGVVNNNLQVKFGYSEKATKFEKIFRLKFDATQ